MTYISDMFIINETNFYLNHPKYIFERLISNIIKFDKPTEEDIKKIIKYMKGCYVPKGAEKKEFPIISLTKEQYDKIMLTDYYIKRKINGKMIYVSRQREKGGIIIYDKVEYSGYTIFVPKYVISFKPFVQSKETFAVPYKVLLKTIEVLKHENYFEDKEDTLNKIRKKNIAKLLPEINDFVYKNKTYISDYHTHPYCGKIIDDIYLYKLLMLMKSYFLLYPSIDDLKYFEKSFKNTEEYETIELLSNMIFTSAGVTYTTAEIYHISNAYSHGLYQFRFGSFNYFPGFFIPELIKLYKKEYAPNSRTISYIERYEDYVYRQSDKIIRRIEDYKIKTKFPLFICMYIYNKTIDELP